MLYRKNETNNTSMITPSKVIEAEKIKRKGENKWFGKG